MSAGLGFFDPRGIWQFGEADNEGLFSDLLNKGQQSTSAAITTDRARLTALERGVMILREEQPSGVSSGAFTAGAWQKRSLNTVRRNTIAGATLVAGVITLPAGTYQVEAAAGAFYVNRHQLRVRRTSATPAAADLVSSGAQNTDPASGGTSNDAQLLSTFTLTATSTIELQHQCSTTRAGNGLGVSGSFGAVEVFSWIRLEKIS